MINIVMFTNVEDGKIRGFEVKGHAGYNVEGKDIVCSAVMAIAYSAIGAMEELLEIKGHTERDGFISFMPKLDNQKLKTVIAETIFKTAVIGFKQIELAYFKYLKVSYKEV